MHAAILLPGPSLKRLSAAPAADVLIGVKRAATAFTCRWAVILDSPCLKMHGDNLLGQPQLVTRAAYRPKHTSLPGLNVEGLQDYCPALDGQWTSTAALALAGWLHCDRVDVYGADFGEGATLEEFDGYRSPEANYTPERWARERAAWARVLTWMLMRGINVHKVN